LRGHIVLVVLEEPDTLFLVTVERIDVPELGLGTAGIAVAPMESAQRSDDLEGLPVRRHEALLDP
jgi:hypothetical protein